MTRAACEVSQVWSRGTMQVLSKVSQRHRGSGDASLFPSSCSPCAGFSRATHQHKAQETNASLTHPANRQDYFGAHLTWQERFCRALYPSTCASFLNAMCQHKHELDPQKTNESFWSTEALEYETSGLRKFRILNWPSTT